MPFENHEPPLKIAVSDSEGNSPYSLALLRGHHGVAKAILEITQVQWVPEEKENVRYQITPTDAVLKDPYDSGGESGDEPEIYQEVLKEELRIQYVGAPFTNVKSNVRPIGLINWAVPTFEVSSIRHGLANQANGKVQHLIMFAITQKDMKLFRCLIDANIHYAIRMPKRSQEAPLDYDEAVSETRPRYEFREKYLREACKLDRTDMLEEVIRRAGAGIPLEELAERNGPDKQTMSRGYQGLTVYGKKRKDWARQGHDLAWQPEGDTRAPPLLLAALQGSLETVEWLFSDTPMRAYHEFGASKTVAENSRLKHLIQAPESCDRAVAKWLGVQNELAIHCAVLGPLGERTCRLMQYLIRMSPASLEAKTPELGYTPLYLACLMDRMGFARVLIEAGADQSVKDREFNNVVHAALTHIWNCHDNSHEKGAEKLRKLLESLDPGFRPELFRRRNHLAHGGNTPLQYFLKIGNQDWLHDDDKKVALAGNLEILHLLLSYSGGAELDMLDGAGDTALHRAVSRELPENARTILQRDPALLLRENAVGQTPAETAHERLMASRLGNLGRGWGPILRPVKLHCVEGSNRLEDMVDIYPQAFVGRDKAKGAGCLHLRDYWDRDRHDRTEPVWEVVEEFLAKTEAAGMKRRLVSHNEARDVARRIGDKFTGQRYHRTLNQENTGVCGCGFCVNNYSNLFDTSRNGGPNGEDEVKENGKRRASETRKDFVTPVYKAAKRHAWADEQGVSGLVLDAYMSSHT